MRKNICLLLVFFLPIIIASQTIKVGDWSIHANYNNINTMATANNKVYVGTRLGLFIYNLSDNSLSTFSKIDGLSSLNISALKYDQNSNSLLIGYNNGNIDILQNNTIINLPDIFFANIVGEKRVNNIFTHNNLAYISCSFGLVIYNLEKREVKETCYFYNEAGIASNVYQAHVFDDDVYGFNDVFLSKKIFVATSDGLFYANKNDNLINFNTWSNDLEYILPDLGEFSVQNTIVKHVIGIDLKKNGGKKLIIGTDISDATMLEDGESYNLFELISPDEGSLTYFSPKDLLGSIVNINYNKNAKKFIITLSDNRIVIMNDFLNITSSLTANNIANGNNSSLSLVSGCIPDNHDNSKELLLGDMSQGLMLFKINGLNVNEELSFLEFLCPNGPKSASIGTIKSNGSNLMFTHGARNMAWGNTYNREEISFYINDRWLDSDTVINNLGIYDVVSGCAAPNNKFFAGTWNNGILEFQNNELLAHFHPRNTPEIDSINGTNGWSRIGGIDIDNNNDIWLTNSETNRPLLKFSTKTRSWESFTLASIATNVMCGQILCGNNGYKWIQLRNEGLLVVDENGESKKIGASRGLASSSVNCFAEDLDGAIWIGTTQGLSIVYFPDEFFNDDSSTAEYIVVENEDGNIERLFDNMDILDIHVDPGNRKWIATKSSGVFLISEDGSMQLYNFTSENSPLLDNTVYKISIIESSGEVFFATGKGLCSYRSDASQSLAEFDNVTVFPNPVKKDYEGLISISGLSNNTSVKITDISGNLVFETRSYGGTATWDGFRFNGERVKTGVYLFLCTSENFEKSVVKKILMY